VENEVIDGVETKSAEFIALEEKFSSLETKLEEFGVATKRLDKIEARLSRPGISGRVESKEDETEIQRKAFVDYARGGAFDTKALSIAGNGGYLVPPVLLNELQKNLVLFSPIRNIARVTSISVPTVTLPKRTANLTGAWVAETGARTESDPTYAQQSFTAYEYATYIDVSLELLEDSLFDLGQSLMQDIGQEFGRAEGAAFVAGNGTGKPIGFLNSPASGQIVAAAGNAIAPDDIVHLFHALPSFYAQQGVSWRTAIPSVLSARSRRRPANISGSRQRRKRFGSRKQLDPVGPSDYRSSGYAQLGSLHHRARFRRHD